MQGSFSPATARLKENGDRSEGFYRRQLILRFNHSVPQDKRDPNLIDKFSSEADSIFLFALEGLKRLIANGYNFSETEINKAELQQYREDSDSVLSFVKDYCVIDKLSSVDSTELFNVYRTYCDECGMKPFSQKTFVQQILLTAPTLSRGVDSLGKKRVVYGLRLGEVLG